MSKLNIPRKQNMTGGAIASSFSRSTDTSDMVDKAHLEKALLENFLAIERYINQQAVSVCMSQSTTHSFTTTGLHNLTGPWDVLWDQYALADTTGDRLRVPGPGIYSAFATILADNIAPSSPGVPGYVYLNISGGSSFMTPARFSAGDVGVTSLTTSSIGFQGLGQIICSFPFLASTAGYISATFNNNSTGIDVNLQAFCLLRNGEIPSKVQ